MRLFSLFLFFACLHIPSFAQFKSDLQKLKLKGKVQTLEESEYSDKRKLMARFKYTFDTRGNIVKLTRDEGVGEKYCVTKYKYDSKGKINEQVDSGSGGFRYFKFDVKPTPKGFVLQSDLTDNEHKDRDKRIISRFDANYNELNHTTYDKKGGVVGEQDYTYDQKNNLVQETWIDSDGISYNQLTYRYNNEGNPVEKKVYAMKPTIKTERSHLIKSELMTYVEFDKMGNWLKKNSVEDTIVKKVVERVITYY